MISGVMIQDPPDLTPIGTPRLAIFGTPRGTPYIGNPAIPDPPPNMAILDPPGDPGSGGSDDRGLADIG